MAGERPNIIFLLTDDHRWDALGAMGNPHAITPHLDHLASEGTLFENAYVTSPICWTSRASILTGQYDRRHGVSNRRELSDAANRQTYPMILKRHGYRVGFVGKYGVGNPPIDDYDYWDAMGLGQPDYEQIDESGEIVHYTKTVRDSALRFLDGGDGSEPFCLSVSFKAPHVEDGDPRQFVYDPAYASLLDNQTMPVPETAAERYFFGVFPEWFTEGNEARKRWKLRFSTPAQFQESVKGYYRLIFGVDAAVGRIREKLRELGIDDNTVIVFMGDNGFYLGEHGMAGKWYGHEESLRVPLIVYDPRVEETVRGQRRDEIALNIDVAPTLLDIAGLGAPEGMQGRSLKGLAEGDEPDSWRDAFLCEQLWNPPERFNIPPMEGFVSLDYKYVRYSSGEFQFEELYDLKADPLEKRNLASSPDWSAMLQRLQKRCDALIEEAK